MTSPSNVHAPPHDGRGRAALLAAALLGATGCVTGRPPSVTFVPPRAAAASHAASWKDVLAAPGKISVVTLVTGRVRVPRSGVLDLENPAVHGQPDDFVWVPVLSHWVHHERFGDFLVDSGLDETFRSGSPGNLHGSMVKKYIDGNEQEAGQDTAAQLRTRGVTLTGVFFTHLHGDHTAGVPGLDKRIRYVAGKDDVYINYHPFYWGDHLAGVARLEELDFSSAAAMDPLGPAIDVFGDGSFWAIATPGHSRGHVSYLVNGEAGATLLTGDASHTRWGFDHGVEPGWADSRPLSRRSLAGLRAFAAAFPTVKLVFGHDLGVDPSPPK